MVKPVVDFMQNYTQTPSRIYDLYQYYMGGGKPNTPPVAPGPAVPFMSRGGGGGNSYGGGGNSYGGGHSGGASGGWDSKPSGGGSNWRDERE